MLEQLIEKIDFDKEKNIRIKLTFENPVFRILVYLIILIIIGIIVYVIIKQVLCKNT
jgi:t-SNARE complex subunit (syntaxin)